MRKYLAVSVALAVGLLLGISQKAFASFVSTGTIVQSSISSATLQPPTAVTATGGCQIIIVGPKITLNWMATTSGFVTSYAISRSATNGGSYTFLASVAGNVTTYVDTSSLSINTSYYYVINSKFLSWNSVNSNQATGTTPLLCL